MLELSKIANKRSILTAWMKKLFYMLFIIFALSMLCLLVYIGVVKIDWKPVAIVLAFAVLYLYQEKIDFIEISSLKLKLKRQLNDAELLFAQLSSVSYNFSCIHLQHISSQIYDGLVSDLELFHGIEQISELQKQIPVDDAKKNTYKRRRNRAILNCIIFVIEEVRKTVEPFQLPHPVHTPEFQALSCFFADIAKCQHLVMADEIKSKNELLNIVAKYKEYLPVAHLQRIEYYISQMEID